MKTITITLTPEQQEAFARGESITISPEKKAIWKPEIGQRYWFAEDEVSYYVFSDDSLDKWLILQGNCFKTEVEAQKHFDYLQAIGRVRMAILEANGECIPTDENRYHISFRKNWREFKIYISYELFASVLPLSYTNDIANQIIKDYEQDLLTIFTY